MNRQITFIAGLVLAATLGVTAGAGIATADDLTPTLDLPLDLPTLPIDLPTLPVPTDPTPTQPDPTPTQPDPTPTQPDPTPTQPDPTPTQPDPTPTQPDPTPADPTPNTPTPQPTSQPPATAVPTPVAGPTSNGAVSSPAPGAITPATPAGGTGRVGPTPAPGTAAAGASPTATGPGGLWSQYPLGTPTTELAPAAGGPAPAPGATTAPASGGAIPAPAGTTPASPPAGEPAPAAAAGDDSSSIPWDTIALALGALVLLAAVAVGREPATAAFRRAAARRRSAVLLSLVEPSRLPEGVPVADPPTHGVVRLDQSDVRWKRGLLGARFVVVATTPGGGEAQIGASTRYWALTDRRSPRSVAALSTLLASFRHSGWYESPAVSLWYRADRLSRDPAWYAWRLQRDHAPVRRSARPDLDRRDAQVAIREAG